MNKEAINQRFTNAVNFLLDSGKALSKGQISEKLSFKRSTFSELLNNRSNVSAETIAVFCDEYGVNSDWLLTGKGEMLKKEGLVQQAHNNISSTITQHQTIHAPEDYETLKQENKRLTQENSGLKDKIIQLMEEKMSK